jgi:UDP:flavonoid glycosyltransferase YjiC (YdhE family)
MKFALIPGNNSLSHVLQCLVIRASLMSRGQDVIIAVGEKQGRFLRTLDIPHEILPDIQENDGAGLPTVEWFKHPRKIVETIEAETNFLKRHKPDRILSVFRFTLKASSRIARIPCDSLICGCMIPEFEEILGFNREDQDSDLQSGNMSGFYRYAGAKMSIALKALGLAQIDDIRFMLKGERTFLWDIPEFLPIPSIPDVIHVGPIYINNLPFHDMETIDITHTSRPLAVVTSGTCVSNAVAVKRIARILQDRHYQVVVAGGWQKELLGVMPDIPWLTAREFVPLHKILSSASLIVCHGGQGTIFEALHNRVPVIVMPFQPEQTHNGICLERIGCGALLVPPQPFRGNPRVYLEALNRMTDEEILSKIGGLVENPETTRNLAWMKKAIDRYKGVETVANMLEAS